MTDVTQIVYDVLRVNAAFPEKLDDLAAVTRLADLGMDSLDVVVVGMELEDALREKTGLEVTLLNETAAEWEFVSDVLAWAKGWVK